MDGTSKLRVVPGQVIRASDHNDLLALAGTLQVQNTVLKGHQDHAGFLPRLELKTTVSAGHAFRIALGEDGDDLLLTFTPAHIAGIMPTIDGEGLDEFDEAGNAPTLRVDKKAWKKVGAGERALVMFRYELNSADFTVAKVEPVAVPAPPARKPFTEDVFVDDPRWRLGRMHMCHMYSPSMEALHGMAAAIGVARHHFQDKPGFPHYDVCKAKRHDALRRGAIAISSREMVRIKNLRSSAKSADAPV